LPARASSETLLTCFACVLYLVIAFAIYSPEEGYDGAQYLRYAENLIKLHQFTYDGINPSCGRTPGYPVFLALFLWLFGSIAPVYFIQLMLMFTACFLLFRVYRGVLPLGWRLGLLFVLSACWPLTRLGMALYSEPLFMALTTGGLVALALYLRQRRGIYLLAFGVLLTLSAYVRPVTMPFVFVACVVLLSVRLLRWAHAIKLVIVSAALLAPWTYRNWVEFDDFIPLAANYGSIYYMTDQTAFEAVLYGSASASHGLPAYAEIVGNDFELDYPANQRYLQRAKENISRDPLGFIRRCCLKTLFVWTYLPGTKRYLDSRPFLFFAGVALQLAFLALAWKGFLLLWQKSRWLAWPGVLFTIYHMMALFPFYAESRFLIPVYLFLCSYAAYAVYNGSINFKKHHNRSKVH
jgi:hypothetical protein